MTLSVYYVPSSGSTQKPELNDLNVKALGEFTRARLPHAPYPMSYILHQGSVVTQSF